MITVAISAVALIVAIYGIFERRQAAYATTRVRLGQLLETIQGYNIDETREGQAHPDEMLRPLGGMFAGRRALVTYQALDLLNQLESAPRLLNRHSELTPEERNALASSLMWLRDFASARDQWRAALETPGNWPIYMRASSHNGYAESLAALGDLDGMRREYQEAARMYPDSPAGIWDKFYTYLTWKWAEGRYGGDQADEAASVAQDAIDELPPGPPRDRAQALLADQSMAEEAVAATGLPTAT